MQILKEEVKERIKEVALAVFEKYGYQKATMRRIASRADLTVGNLYRYFKNKDDLFDVIIQPAFQEIYRFVSDFDYIKENEFHKKGQKQNFIKAFQEALIKIYGRHRAELLILLNGSKGSHMENAKEEIVHLITDRLKKEIFPKMENDVKPVDDFLAEAFSISFMEGISLVLGRYDDKEKTKELFVKYIHIYFKYFLDELR